MSVDCRSASAEAVAAEERGPDARRRSRFGRRRAWVLLAVHLAILAHVLHWLWGGTTLSPVEPSEATDLAEHGRLNAGAIFFFLAIGSTLVFGRWFCGWACHLVALQDGCRWILQRLGVRPRPMQLGVLALVPLVACIYMFLGPWLYRLWRGHAVETHVALYTERFWETFPGLTMSVVTFVVCGFAMVYFLGSKGFCTYACPYGAIFGVVDQLAPQRIRVTDACQGCGQCTLACSSNVRVHQEVRDFGAVVDPGCMKCLDCVAACPMDALHVGFGAPALWTARRTPDKRPAGAPWSRLALSGAFVFGLFVVLLSHQRPLDLAANGGFVASLAAGALALAWLFRGRSTRVGGPSLGEEAVVAASYLAALHALRGYRPFAGAAEWLVERAPWSARLGLSEGLPLLLSLGVAGLIAYGVLLAGRLMLRSEVSMQAVVLRRGGRVTRSGWSFAVAMAAVLAVTAHAGVVRSAERREAGAVVASAPAFEAAFQRGMSAMASGELEAARTAFEEALDLSPESFEARKRLAGVNFGLRRDSEAQRLVDGLLVVAPDDLDSLFLAGLLAIRRGDASRAQVVWERVLVLDPGHPAAREAMAALSEERGDARSAAAHRARARRTGD